jgi:hypothetical protein
MKRRNKMYRKIRIIVVLLLTFFPISAFAYMENVHKKISVKAVEKSLVSEVLKNIGLEKGIEQEIKGRFKEPKSVIQWIEYGSEWEDFILFPPYPFLMIYPG